MAENKFELESDHSKYTSSKEKRYHGSNQEQWNKFSERTVQSIAKEFQQDSPPTAKDLLFRLGQERQKIAQDLNHSPERQRAFGQFRKNYVFPDCDPSENNTRESIDSKHRYYKQAVDYCDKTKPTISDNYGFYTLYSSLLESPKFFRTFV